jgi:uncharacterized protein YjbI with pentapeptide repeats
LLKKSIDTKAYFGIESSSGIHMPSFHMKHRKIHFKRLKKINCFKLCKLFLASLPAIVFGAFTVIFTLQQEASANAAREQDQRQADEINRRTIFKEYIDDMTELLLNRNENANISMILLHIRVQTLTVLQTLDMNRKRDVIVFLYENRLLQSDGSSTVDLRGANLNGMRFWSSSTVACHLPLLYLPGVYAENIIFDGCSLSGAVFDGSSMSAAKFLTCGMRDTSFVNTNLTRAQFQGNVLHTVSFSGSQLVQSSIKNGVFKDIDLTNVDLYQAEVADELLHPSKNADKAPHTFLNTRYPNGSFTHMNRENLIVNGEPKLQVRVVEKR